MLGTSTTPYDLRFRLLDIPVRIHPMFWLVSLALGWRDNDLPGVLLFAACVFISILVHEFGHGLMARRFRGEPSIVLYGLGGLCYSHTEKTSWRRLAVILAGPGAGLTLCLVVLLATSLAFGLTPGEHLAIIRRVLRLGVDPEGILNAMVKLRQPMVFEGYWALVDINLRWSLVNLLPIWPLDGGQATQVVMSMADRRQGVRRSHIVSLVTAGILAVVCASGQADYFLTIFFGLFAFMNYQVLQTLQHSGTFADQGGDDWWRE
jgi:Zn-dependent protease